MKVENLWKKRAWTTKQWITWAESVAPHEAIRSMALVIEIVYKKQLDLEDRLTELEKRKK